jgi:polyisoprenoid-binding protein YceI
MCSAGLPLLLLNTSIMRTSILLLALLGAFALRAQTFSVSTHQVKISGSSNVQNWESAVNKVSGTAQLLLSSEGVLESVEGLRVQMEVASIKSEKGSTMDNKTQEALKAKQHPNITFTQARLQSLTRQGNTYILVLVGQLEVAGARKTITLRATGSPQGAQWQFGGEMPLKMTDFKVDPPTAMLGAMRTADDVTIKFNVTMSR